MQRRTVLGTLIAVAVMCATIAIEGVAIRAFFPHLPRLTTDFSAAYLQRELASLRDGPQKTIFLGDSVLWGYGLQPDRTAIRLLEGDCSCVNLAFKAGSPPNYYALLRLLDTYGVRPRIVVLEINQRVFNSADNSYKTLHPAIASLAWPLLSPQDRALLTPPTQRGGAQARLDGVLASLSQLYAMRSDIRETLYGNNDAPPAAPPTAASFEGTYDLTPLDEKNVGVHFLIQAADLMRAHRIPFIAFMTPTNHALLHDYIDVPEYRANGAFLSALLKARGGRVLDLDRAFPRAEFLDNDHLTVAGQRRLATYLRNAVSGPEL